MRFFVRLFSVSHAVLFSAVIVAAGPWTSHLLPFLAPFMHPTGQVVFHFKVPDKLIPLFTEPLFKPYAGLRAFNADCADRGSLLL